MSESMALGQLVFVYGTLRRGECNDIARYQPTPVSVGMGWVQGRLYDLGPYPGALFANAESTAELPIVGEVYRVTPEVEAQLDLLEGVQPDGCGEYRKKEVLVQLAGQTLCCLAYEIHPARLRGVAPIPGGDWVCRRESV